MYVSRYQNVSIMDFVAAKDEGGGCDNLTGAIRRAKLQSNLHRQHPTFYKPGAIPVAKPTVSEH